MTADILTNIHNKLTTFSKGQRRIATYILESYDKAAFLTAGALGKITQVSESTVVRFAAELGYDGYPAMQRALQEMVLNRLTSVQRIEVTDERLGEQDVVSTILQADMDRLRHTTSISTARPSPARWRPCCRRAASMCSASAPLRLSRAP